MLFVTCVQMNTRSMAQACYHPKPGLGTITYPGFIQAHDTGLNYNNNPEMLRLATNILPIGTPSTAHMISGVTSWQDE